MLFWLVDHSQFASEILFGGKNKLLKVCELCAS
uniref:Uncharacterized protein n=1 Tax=Anguilla anguilla TaxID=7936 RepID=A0A0E9QIW6_ANGAN